MGDKSAIEWTDATWNPVRGCAIVSKGCTNCYAMRQAHRSNGAGGAYEGLTKMTKGGPVWTGEIRTVPELLDAPLRWRRPRRIFVNSMSDLFHEDVPDDFIDKVFATMGACDDGGLGHTFQVLTKRPTRMRAYMTTRARAAWNGPRMNRSAFPPRNVWLGVSVEDQAAADERIPLLLQTPAAVRWISAEPLLGPVELWKCTTKASLQSQLQWVVVGGESGPGARPMHPDWARSLRDQCSAGGVPFFFKQWGGFRIGEFDRHQDVAISWQDGKTEWFGDHADIKYTDSWLDDCVIAWRAPKKSTGRQLDGRTHDEYPA